METINTLELIDESVYPDEKVLKTYLVIHTLHIVNFTGI